MRPPWIIAALLCLALATPAAAADKQDSSTVARWPDTRVGALARGWVTAFNTGEDAMRGFLKDHMAAKSLAEKDVPARVERYRTLREKYGRLQLERVIASSASELTVKLLDVEAHAREFTFRSETTAPYRLTSVTLKEFANGIHGMFGGFHHR
jgi:hypothetical protein